MNEIWQGCYDDGWQGDITPEAFSHPAKFSRGLIHRIYLHAKEMGWVKPGDYVLDPFGGVALGGLDALSMGLNWIGVELEEKFVSLGQQNIALWNRQLKGWPNLGTARIVQGDSRNLRGMIEKADLVISSPPFTPAQSGGGINKHGYTSRPDLGPDWVGDRTYSDKTTGHTPGNLANMREGDIDLVVSSPPFMDNNVNIGAVGDTPAMRQQIHNSKKRSDSYGSSPGQLGSMKEGSFDLCVSSPPYSEIRQDGGSTRDGYKGLTNYSGEPRNYWPTQRNQQNLGNVPPDTFWSASREIVQGSYELLKPGGHAIWVCKDYVKAKKRVPFSDRWQALCESVGFKTVCRHQAMLVKEHGIQTTIHGDEKITTERKSFFRRLAESKGSPRIDWEDVICMVKF